MKFGPNFGAELTAAGLGPGLSWTEDELFGRENLSLEDQAKLDEVIAHHDPTKTIVPETISDRQFFQAAAMKGLITEQEALAAVRTGTLPAQLRDFVAGVTDPQQHFAIEMTLSGATQFERHHAMVDAIGHALGYSDDQMDDLWRLGGSL